MGALRERTSRHTFSTTVKEGTPGKLDTLIDPILYHRLLVLPENVHAFRKVSCRSHSCLFPYSLDSLCHDPLRSTKEGGSIRVVTNRSEGLRGQIPVERTERFHVIRPFEGSRVSDSLLAHAAFHGGDGVILVFDHPLT